jgi:hypothetical protein
LNWILRNISLLLLLIACHEPETIAERPEETAGQPPQASFVRSLRSKGLIESMVDTQLVRKIEGLCEKTKYAGRLSVNGELDSTKLNFYIVNSDRDSSLRNVCAYIGHQTILLDKIFLTSFLDRDTFFQQLPRGEHAAMVSSFQSWVIGHEIAHAELGHGTSHFVSYRKPKDSREGLAFHHLEVAADERSLAYAEEPNPDLREKMLLRLFQADYDSIYGAEPTSPNRYLKYFDEYGMQRPYVFRGVGSHPLMMYRSALLLLLTSKNKTIQNEAYIFLIEISAFSNVRKWHPSEQRDVKIPAFTR